MLWILATALSISQLSEEEGVRRVHAHLLIEDAVSALDEAIQLESEYPDSPLVKKTLIEAFAANGQEESALDLWNRLAATDPNILYDRNLLEELAWGVLKKGTQSTQYGVRLASTIGAYLTRDVRAIPILLRMMRDSNAVIRSVAIQMAGAYRDAPLKDEIVRLMDQEKVWLVRLEVMKAAGLLRIKELSDQLQALVQSEKTLVEERQIAITSLLEMYDKVSLDELKALAHSRRAGLRHLACSIATHFEMAEAKDEITHLLQDPHPGVRIAALNAFGLVYHKQMGAKEAKELLNPLLEDSDPAVAITAGWAHLLVDAESQAIAKWLDDFLPENRRLAAAALASLGNRGEVLAKNGLRTSSDPYVKANLALGLLGIRSSISLGCDTLYEFLEKEKRLWMWDSKSNPLFKVLSPSQVRHNDQVPNYPEAIDQMTRLNLVTLLALVDDPRALPALKTFLQRKSWGISGVAAATLIQEGDETALEMVKQLLHDPDPNIHMQACLVLAMFGKDESVLRELQGIYASADHEKKLHILEAIGKIGNAQSYSFLVGVLREPFPILRVAAAAALIQSVNR